MLGVLILVYSRSSVIYSTVNVYLRWGMIGRRENRPRAYRVLNAMECRRKSCLLSRPELDFPMEVVVCTNSLHFHYAGDTTDLLRGIFSEKGLVLAAMSAITPRTPV